MALIDNAIYVNGQRTGSPHTLNETYELLRRRNGMAWIGLYRPDKAELHSIAEEFGLHPLAVEDALKGHQRAKLERFGDTLFVVLRPARYLDKEEIVEFGEVHLFVGPGFVVTVRHAANPDLAHVRRRLESDPELLARGPEAVLYSVLDEVVDGYAPVIAGLENDIDEIQDQLFNGSDRTVSRRIFELLREVMAFQRATEPLHGMLAALELGAEKYNVDVELQRALRDVLDHVVRITERAESFRALLEKALTVHSTLVSQEQNEEIKKISAWAAILFAPTLIGTIYGMNFEVMPELEWPLGYPLALVAMVAFGAVLYGVFKFRRWL